MFHNKLSSSTLTYDCIFILVFQSYSDYTVEYNIGNCNPAYHLLTYFRMF